MPLDDARRVPALDGRRGGARDLKKDVHANGKIRGVNKSSARLFHGLADLRQGSVPAGSSHHHVLAFSEASLNIGQDALRRGEVNYNVSRPQIRRGERSRISVFGAANHADLMAALAGYFGDQRASLAPA